MQSGKLDKPRFASALDEAAMGSDNSAFAAVFADPASSISHRFE